MTKSNYQITHEQYYQDRARRDEQEAHRKYQETSPYVSAQSYKYSGKKAPTVREANAVVVKVLDEVKQAPPKYVSNYYDQGKTLLEATVTACHSYFQAQNPTGYVSDKLIGCDLSECFSQYSHWQEGFKVANKFLTTAFLCGEHEAADELKNIYSFGWPTQDSKLAHFIVKVWRVCSIKDMNYALQNKPDIREFVADAQVMNAVTVIKQNATKYGGVEITPEVLAAAQQSYNSGLISAHQIFIEGVSQHTASSSSSSSAAYVEWQSSGQGYKTVELKKENVVYGAMTEVIINTPYNFKINGAYVQVVKFRAIKLPDSIKPGMEFTWRFALQDPNGSYFNEEGAKIAIKYNKEGQFIRATFPNQPIYSMQDPNAPVIMQYHGKPYTVPMTSANYYHLTTLLNQNKGVLEFLQVDQLPLMVEPVVVFTPMATQAYHNPVAYPNQTTHVQPIGEDTACNCVII